MLNFIQSFTKDLFCYDLLLKYNYLNCFEFIKLNKIIVKVPLQKKYTKQMKVCIATGLVLLTNSKNIEYNENYLQLILLNNLMYNFLIKLLYIYTLTFTFDMHFKFIKNIQTGSPITFVINDIKNHAFEFLNEYEKFTYISKLYINLIFNTTSKKLIKFYLSYFINK